MKFSALFAFDTDTSSFNALVSLLENLTGSHCVPMHQKDCSCVTCCQFAQQVENYQNITILSRAVSMPTIMSKREIENNKETWCTSEALLLSVSKQLSFVNLVFPFVFLLLRHAGSRFE